MSDEAEGDKKKKDKKKKKGEKEKEEKEKKKGPSKATVKAMQEALAKMKEVKQLCSVGFSDGNPCDVLTRAFLFAGGGASQEGGGGAAEAAGGAGEAEAGAGTRRLIFQFFHLVLSPLC